MIIKIKKHLAKIIGILVLIVLSFGIYNCSFSMNNLPRGEFLKELESPNSEHTLKAYLYSGGATMDWSLRVELVDNKTKEAKNIYWKYHDKDVEMKWLDNDNVKINGRRLNVHKDTYRD